MQNLTFAGNGIVPINVVPANANKVDVQNVQTSIVDQSIENQPGAPLLPAVQSDLPIRQQQSVYADSWWYNSAGGLLQGVNDDAGDVGPLTNPAWQLGPISNVGGTGFTWSPNGTPGVQAGSTALDALNSPGGSNATTGQYMIYSGIYGPNGSNSLTQSTLASQFVNGLLTVPIAQIVTTGDIRIPGTYSNAAEALQGAPGSGTFIGLIGTGVSNGPTGNGTYNVYGGDPNIDTGFYYNFSNPRNIVLPEPGTIFLAGIAAVGMNVARQTSQHKASWTRRHYSREILVGESRSSDTFAGVINTRSPGKIGQLVDWSPR